MQSRKLVFALALVSSVFVYGVSARAADKLLRARPDQVGLSSEKLERIGALFQDHVARRQIAGAVVLIARHGQVAYQAPVGMQDIEAGVAMSPETIFRIASMTKPVTSAAIMTLVDQGLIDLADPISRYLPEFKFMQVAVPRPKK